LQLLIILICTIFVADALTTLALSNVRIDPLFDALLDAVSLTAILFPVLYFGVFKAMSDKNALLTLNERALLDAQGDLSRRVDARTADLATANQQLERSMEESEEQRKFTAIVGKTVSLLQACQNSNEAYGIIAMGFRRLFPRVPGALYVFKPSRHILERTIGWNKTVELAASSFAPDDCWALRLGKLHKSLPNDEAIRCPHLSAVAGTTACLPVTAAGEVLGLLSFWSDPENAETARAAKPDELGFLAVMGQGLATALSSIRLREGLRNEATHDLLTGLFNRRFMDEAIDLELSGGERNKTPLAVVMFDVDHFKQFNDRFGHEAGDAVLASLGAFINRRARKSDIACRYGGEELLIVLPGADKDAAMKWADSVRKEIERMVLTVQSRQIGPVTVSGGVASYPLDADNKADLLKAADEALYRSKASGRNRITAASCSDIALIV
jgi:diguanylate cyclase (GGDEF)-like protein